MTVDWTDHLSDTERALVAALNSGDEHLIANLEAQVEIADDRRPLPPLAAAALYYAARNIPVFQLLPLRKKPFPGSAGFKDATTDEATVRGWWTHYPRANIGIPTGVWFDVVDIDGPDGVRSRLDHPEILASLQVRAIVSTPRPGGLHYWIPPGGRGNGAKILPGVDYRGQGGYVVAPPSVLEELDGDHADGPQHAGTYHFIRPPVLNEVPTV